MTIHDSHVKGKETTEFQTKQFKQKKKEKKGGGSILTTPSASSPYHEMNASPTLSQTVNTATNILKPKGKPINLDAQDCIEDNWCKRNLITSRTSIDTKSEVAQSLAYSFQQFYSTHKQDKHSQKSSC